MSRERKALPEDDDLRLSAGATESESALDTFELERALLATDLQGRPPEEDPMDFFADEDPSVLLDRSDELSEVTWYNPVVLPSADHTRESYSNASSEARVLTAIVMSVFSALVFFAVTWKSPGASESMASNDGAPIEARALPVTAFLAQAVVNRQIDVSDEAENALLEPSEPPPASPEPSRTVVARPTVRGLTPPAPGSVSPRASQSVLQAAAPRPTPQAPAASVRLIESEPPIVPAVAVPAVASVDRSVETGAATRAVATVSPETPATPSDADNIGRVLARYRAAFNVLDSGAAKAVWPSVDSRALGRAFDRLEAQNLEFNSCDMSVAGSNASVSCNGTARYVPKVGHRDSVVESRQWKFALKKSGDEWIIDQVEAR